MKKIFLFLTATLISLVVGATEYNVIINNANIYPKSENDIDITSQLGGALLQEGDEINLTIKGYFSVAVNDVTYVGVVDNSEAASYWTPLSGMDYYGASIGAAVNEGEECNVTVNLPIIADAVSNEKIIVRINVELSAKVSKTLGDGPVKLRATAEELNAVASEYTVEMPTTVFTLDGTKQFKAEIDFETEEVIKKDDILNLKINGTFNADINSLCVMVFDDNVSEILPWTQISFFATKDNMVDATIPIVMPSNFDGKTGDLVVFVVYDDETDVPAELSFVKDGEEVQEGVELASKEFTTLVLNANVWGTGSNYQSEAIEIAAPAAGFQVGDYVSFSITGVASQAITGLEVVLIDDYWGAVSEYEVIAENIEENGDLNIVAGKIALTKVTESCRLVFSTTDAVIEGVDKIIIENVSEPVEIVQKVSLSYNPYGNGDLGTGERSYSWKLSNTIIINQAVRTALGDEDFDTWALAKGQQFSLEVKGTCNATGTLKTGIVDEQQEANWWFSNSEFGSPEFTITEGEEFSATILYTITGLASDGFVSYGDGEFYQTAIDIPGLVFMFEMEDYAAATAFNNGAPSEDPNGVKRVQFNFTSFNFSYLGSLEEYSKPYLLGYTGTGYSEESYMYQTFFNLEYDNAATTSDYFNFHISGVATQDISSLMIALWDASPMASRPYSTSLTGNDEYSMTTILTNITAGETFDVEKTLPLFRNSNGTDNQYSIVLMADSPYEGTQIILDLYSADEFSISTEGNGNQNPIEEVVKTVSLPYNPYGNGDTGMGDVSYSWQYGDQYIIDETVEAAIGEEGFDSWFLQLGQQFVLEVEGTCNASGTLQTGIIDQRYNVNYWFEYSQFGAKAIPIEEDKPFKATFLYTIKGLASSVFNVIDKPELVYTFDMADYEAATAFNNGVAPSEDPNGVKNVLFNFTTFKFSYLGNLNDLYTKPYSLEKREETKGGEYFYGGSFDLAYDKAATTSDYFNVNIAGFATQDIDTLQIALIDASYLANIIPYATSLCAEYADSATTIITDISAGAFSVKASLPLLRNSNGSDNIYKIVIWAQSKYSEPQIILDLADADEFIIGENLYLLGEVDKDYLYDLLSESYQFFTDVQEETLIIGTCTGCVSQTDWNEFRNAWQNANETYNSATATQDEVDAAAERLYISIATVNEASQNQQDTTESITLYWNEWGPNYQTGLTDVLFNAVKEATGNEAWIPTIGDTFMVELRATPNKSGDFQMAIVDQREEANYYTEMCGGNYPYAEISEGEEFTMMASFVIQKVEVENTLESSIYFGHEYYLTAPDLLFDFRTTDNQDDIMVLSNVSLSVIYNEPAVYENPLNFTFYDQTDEGLYRYRANISEGLPTTLAKVGQQVNIEFSGTATSDMTNMYFVFAENGPDNNGQYWIELIDAALLGVGITEGQTINVNISVPIKKDDPCRVADYRALIMAESTEKKAILVVDNYSVNITLSEGQNSNVPEIETVEIPDISFEADTTLPTIDLAQYFTAENEKISYSVKSSDNTIVYPVLIGDKLELVQYGSGTATIEISAWIEGTEVAVTESFTITVVPKQDQPISPCRLFVELDIISDVTCFGGNDGKIEIVVAGGVEPYTFKWSTGRTSNGIYSVPAGEYSVLISDSVGCSTLP